LGVLAAAYGSEPKWEARLGEILGRLHERVRSTLGRTDYDYLLATTGGQQIVAVSGLARTHETGQNFLTGVCSHPKHQRLGLGTHLLSHSLHRLHTMGVPSARVYTEEGSAADRFLYPRFNSTRLAGVDYPGGRKSGPPLSRLMRGWVRFSA
jgi:ribosomal protein S18 acetylase RimI-like enzyme